MTCSLLHKSILALVLIANLSLARADSDPSLLIVDLHFNGQQFGDAFVLRNDSDEYYIEESWLELWTVQKPYPAAVKFREKSYYSIVDFPGASSEFDDLLMKLNVSMPATLMAFKTIDIQIADTPTPSTAYGFYADYDLNYQRETKHQFQNFSSLVQTNFFGSMGNINANLLYRNVSGGGSEDLNGASNGVNVLDLTYTRDDPANVRSLRIGDILTDPGTLSRSQRIGGVQFATNFSTQPTLITYPLPSFYGQSAVPTALDVYVNGQLQHREQVAAGSYLLQDVPVMNGAGQMQVVAVDALGRQQVFTQDFYVATSLLKEGLNEYSFSAGALREAYGLENFEYGDFVASGSWRHGYRDHLTIGGHGEVSNDVSMLGGSGQYLINAGGIINAGLGISNSKAGVGTNWLLGFEQSRDVYSYRVRISGASAKFAVIGMTEPQPEFQLFGSAGFRLPFRGSAGVVISHEKFRQLNDRTVLSLNYSTTFQSGISLSAYMSYLNAEDSDVTVGIRLSAPIGERHFTSGGLTHNKNNTVTQADFRRNLSAGTGYGYHLAANTADNSAIDVGGVAQNDYATYSLALRTSESSGQLWQASALGSIAHLDGVTQASRQIRDAFAVVNVGNYEGVRVYRENQVVGRTNKNGQIFVPGLRPYLRNRLRIEPDDLPLNAKVGDLSFDTAPFFKSGVVIEFDVVDARNAILKVVLPDGSPIRQGAIARIMGQEKVFPIGTNGRLYLQGLEQPSQITIRWNGSICDFVVPQPNGVDMIPDLGEFVCEPREFE